MKNLKKLFSVLLVLVLSLFAINTFANETVKGSITVNKTVEGKVYDIYKIFDLTYSGSNVAYTIDTDWNGFFFGTDAIGKEYIVDTNTGSLNQITVGDTTKYINITDANIVEFTQKALEYARGVAADDSKEATGTSLVFDNLELGYYLVYPQGATEKDDANGSIASIDSTMKDATVNVKAKYPEIKKEVNKHTFNVGEYAEFTITGKVPDTTGFETYTYQINDTWTAGLELDTTENYKNVEFKVTIAGEEINVKPVYTENGFTLTIDMTDYQTKENTSLVGEEVELTYKLKVTEEAIDSKTTKNSATLTYSNNPKTDTTTTTNPQEEYVFSSKVVVTKVDGADNSVKLSGATFVLMNGNKYYKAETVNGKLEVKWVNTEAEATKYTTGEDGIISFEGLKDGSYKLVETKAPEGYNKLPQPVEVEVNGNYSDTKKPTPVVTETTVENNAGTELPSTGGFGTTMFIMIGSLLTVLSMVVLVTNKRMAKEYL